MKNYTCIILLLLLNSSGVLGGDRQLNRNYHPRAFSNPGQNNFLNSFTPFYSQDFSAGLPSGWKSIDSSGSGVKWHYTTTGAFNGIDSLSETGTSAADGYMIYDSDSAGQPVGGENSDLISDSINCSAHSNVHLNFNEFLTYYNDTATVWISIDGTTWTQIHNSSAGLGQFQSTPNPNNVDIDISSIAANEPKVYIRFNYRADYSFFWMIDDIQLYQAPDKEAALTKIVAPATSCTFLSANEDVILNILNSGGDTITGGLSATFIVDGGTPVTETVPGSIAPNTTHAYTFTAKADISLPGDHSITAYISLSGDTILSNDTLSDVIHNGAFAVNTSSNYINGFETQADTEGLAVEDGNSDSFSWAFSNIFPYAGNSCMEIASVTADDWLFTQCLDLDAGYIYKLSYYYRINGTSSQARLQIMAGPGQTSSGMVQEIYPTTLLSNIFYLPGSQQFSVSPTGTYYIGFHVLNGDSAVTGFRLDDVTLVTDSGVGISNIDKSPISFFPNPSSGIVFVNSKQNISAKYKIEATNSVGQIIFSEFTNELNNYEINLNEQPVGIYLVRIISDAGIVTRKISIAR